MGCGSLRLALSGDSELSVLARNTGTPNRCLGFKTLRYILASIADLATCVRIIIIINSLQIIFVTETLFSDSL